MTLDQMELKRPKAVVIGGSIAGVSCAHSLLRAGWEVVVIDKSSGPQIAPSTGAGLAIDPLSCKIIELWLGSLEPLNKATLPLTIEQSQAVDTEKNRWLLTRDESFNFRATHWSDLHFMLRSALPPEIFLWGHLSRSFCISEDKASVTVKAQVLHTGDIIEITGDLLVAADGSVSSVRGVFLPDLKLRYSGNCAWRGVQDFSENEESSTLKEFSRAYPDLGNCVYYDLCTNSHCVIYEVPGKRINWAWGVNQPEPDIKGKSVTVKPDNKAIELMHLEAEKVWGPELAKLIRETKEPFLNAIYDSDPLDKIFWDNVVLVGDAAHPTTPHSARSTNSAILDAAVLGKCLEKHRGLQNLQDALSEYQFVRLPVMAEQVLHSRRVGQIRQGLALTVSEPFDPRTVSEEVCRLMQQRTTPFFNHIPDILDLRLL